MGDSPAEIVALHEAIIAAHGGWEAWAESPPIRSLCRACGATFELAERLAGGGAPAWPSPLGIAIDEEIARREGAG